jgi:hydroxymethylpyrimidine pyrophosphatase-like HAD family hydrolase
MSAPCKYPPSRTIAVDVDGTLLVNGRLNAKLVEFCRAQRARGFSLTLWSARGKAYAQAVVERFDVADLFDDIVGKPGYIVDDLGWTWIKYTQVVRSFGSAMEGVDGERSI